MYTVNNLSNVLISGDLGIGLFLPGELRTVLQIIIAVVAIFYIFYAFILTRQVRIMNKTFTTPLAPFFTLVAAVHLVVAIILAFLAIIIL
jgi:hypothetical protein